MSITKVTDFKGKIYIPNVETQGLTSVNDTSRLQGFIDDFEPEIIELALGKKLSNEFFTNINTNGALLGTADPKWGRLLNGHEYTINGVTYYWRGILETKGSIRKNLIANYVYYHFIKDGVRQKSSLGVIKADVENAKTMTVSAIPTLSNSWRELIKWYGDCNGSYNYGDHYYHRGVLVSDYSGMRDNTKNVSLYQFMTDNKADYDDWHFTGLENKNSFDI